MLENLICAYNLLVATGGSDTRKFNTLRRISCQLLNDGIISHDQHIHFIMDKTGLSDLINLINNL